MWKSSQSMQAVEITIFNAMRQLKNFFINLLFLFAWWGRWKYDLSFSRFFSLFLKIFTEAGRFIILWISKGGRGSWHRSNDSVLLALSKMLNNHHLSWEMLTTVQYMPPLYTSYLDLCLPHRYKLEWIRAKYQSG